MVGLWKDYNNDNNHLLMALIKDRLQRCVPLDNNEEGDNDEM